MLKAIVFAIAIGCASAACPNDCGGHGVCGLSTQCECYRNWYGADCTLRVCTFGRAFVDSPVGDLNGDGELNPSRSFDPSTNVWVEGMENIVGGTTELYDWQYGYARSTAATSWNEAHFYRECSNKGLCDRSTGLCDCFPGYEGEGCVRTACPNDCSGHGTCNLISNADDTNDDYSAWDNDKTQVCECDAGYDGPDCSMRSCPHGADPVQYAQYVTNSIQGIYWTDMDSSAQIGEDVYYTVTYTDEFGDEWTSSLLSIGYTSGSVDTGVSGYSIEEQVEALNTSLLALPAGVNTYVWGVQSGDRGTGTATITGSYPDDGDVDSDTTSEWVDSLDFRLDQSIVDSECGSSGAYGMCFYVKIDLPGTQNPLRVRYFYRGEGETRSVTGATDGFGSTPSDTTLLESLVHVEDVQAARAWNANDGDVEYAFVSAAISSDDSEELDVCSKRGVCDYDTGLCECFSGYSGLRCDDQNAIAYSY